MKEQFCTYEISLKLKELGFVEECLAYYSKFEIDRIGQTNLHFLPRSKEKKIQETLIYKNSNYLQLPDNFKKYHDYTYLSGQRNMNVSIHLVSAPLWQQAIDFLDTKYNIVVLYNKYDNGFYWGEIFSKEKGGLIQSPLKFFCKEKAREEMVLTSIKLCQKEK